MGTERFLKVLPLAGDLLAVRTSFHAGHGPRRLGGSTSPVSALSFLDTDPELSEGQDQRDEKWVRTDTLPLALCCCLKQKPHLDQVTKGTQNAACPERSPPRRAEMGKPS